MIMAIEKKAPGLYGMSRQALVVCLTLGVLALAAASGLAASLENSDCVKCHAPTVARVQSRGQEHQSAVGCLDCHLEHPPAGKKVIPECRMCHDPDSKPHYAVSGCLACHDPHAPRDIDLARAPVVKAVCSSCHTREGGQLDEYPSRHSELDCTECHTRHGSWLSCLDCHEAHSADMTYQTCLRCHQPHMPTVVKYDSNVPNNMCAGCHGDVVDTLAANRTKHHDLLCVYCHKFQHRLVPTCDTCHGLPHGTKMHKKYPDCRTCHFGPHALDKSGQ